MFKRIDGYFFNYWKKDKITTFNFSDPLTEVEEKVLQDLWKFHKKQFFFQVSLFMILITAYEIFLFFYKRFKKNEKFEKEIKELIIKDGFEKPKQPNKKN
jgi:hypothetical protein